MSSAGEPPNGDFVAYIEQLQRESAARILAQSKQVMVELPVGRAPRGGGAGSVTGTHPDARLTSLGTGMQDLAAAAPPEQAMTSVLPLSRLEADKLLARLASDRATAQQVGSGIALIIGVLLILYWFTTRAGYFPLLLGGGLLMWSVRKLRRTAAQRADVRPDAGRAVIAKVFGQRPPQP